MKILGKNIERYTLVNYITQKPENIWASHCRTGMSMIDLDADAVVTEIDDRTIITSNRIGSFVLAFTSNPSVSDDILYAGLHALNPLGMMGPPIAVGRIPKDLESVKDFIFDSIFTLVEAAEDDRAAGHENVPNAVPIGETGTLIMRMGFA